ncbi:Mpo1-like protein [Salinimonas lutimaris]|uniref:Mpo1-like protein n=1 Tax=Salinimonas lutimaris TaxID=914153 RepID=UPI0010C0C3A3|nr:Mpo1-like protein [Salinimonas lutimaris]
MSSRFTSFAAFYPYYLSEHAQATCRQLHFAGSSLVLLILAMALLSQQSVWLFTVPLVGYGFAWVGHFFFEKNRPATFRYPLYSLMGDWVMFKDILCGRVSLKGQAFDAPGPAPNKHKKAG